MRELFSGWNEALIWAHLDGEMGESIEIRNEGKTESAMITVADFCFLAGKPNAELLKRISAIIIVPQNEAWEHLIESELNERVIKERRYAIKKEPDVFDRNKLKGYAASLDGEFEFKRFDEEICRQAMKEEWSEDLCAGFLDCDDFLKRGIGFAALKDGTLVSGASSYAVYKGGIEIEIDTRNDYRRRGLATACGAKLILHCLDNGLYPSWDAYDLRSVALAEKLGYHLDKPYSCYYFMDE
ncbi:MAG: GNAT family N-acetyltransferase [Clostridia bacterium]|nr:GNAT family N-acetyltransferase [Clostridia bacterium]